MFMKRCGNKYFEWHPGMQYPCFHWILVHGFFGWNVSCWTMTAPECKVYLCLSRILGPWLMQNAQFTSSCLGMSAHGGSRVQSPPVIFLHSGPVAAPEPEVYECSHGGLQQKHFHEYSPHAH